jgi:hypothetical protein
MSDFVIERVNWAARVLSAGIRMSPGTNNRDHKQMQPLLRAQLKNREPASSETLDEVYMNRNCGALTASNSKSERIP